MTIHPTLLTLASIGLLAAGCDKEPSVSRQAEKVEVKAVETARDLKDYTFAQKEDFSRTMQAQLAEINRDMDQLAAKIEKSGDAAKAEARPRLQALRDQRSKLNNQVDDIKNATESTWDSVKATSRKGFAELKDGFTQAREWVSEKIAP